MVQCDLLRDGGMYFIPFLALSMLCFHKETKADDAVDIAVKVFLKLGTIEGGG